MKVYLLEAYSDDSDWIIGIFKSFDAARAAIPWEVEIEKLEWSTTDYWRLTINDEHMEDDGFIYNYYLKEYELRE